jgi:hypothetical protein
VDPVAGRVELLDWLEAGLDTVDEELERLDVEVAVELVLDDTDELLD